MRKYNTKICAIFFICLLIFATSRSYASLTEKEEPEIARNKEIEKASEMEKAFKEAERKTGEAKQENIEKEKTNLNLQLHGQLKNETAYRISTPGKLTKIKNQILLTGTGTLSENARFRLSGRFYYDEVYYATHNFPVSVRSDQGTEAELRETYLDYSKDNWDFRLGKQQIVWGESIGLFFADVVNAKDLREYVLPDFNMIRIPEWAVDIEHTEENLHTEFVWLPFLQFNKLGVSGSEFELPYPVPSGTSFSAIDPPKPGNNFKNSRVGLRFSYLVNGWDTTIFGLYGWDQTQYFLEL